MKTKTYDLKRMAIILTVIFSVFTLDVSANQSQPLTVINDPQPAASIRYIGAEDGFLYFQIDLTQPTENRSMLRINDENGYALYKEEVSEKNYSRRFKVSKDDVNNLEFVFATKEKVVKKSFTIDVRLVERIEVKEVARL